MLKSGFHYSFENNSTKIHLEIVFYGRGIVMNSFMAFDINYSNNSIDRSFSLLSSMDNGHSDSIK